MNYSKIQRFWWFVYWLSLVVSFVVIGFFLVTQATGYRFNPHQNKYQKTGLIIVSSAPADSFLELDGKSYPLSATTRIPNIIPGVYRLSIVKENYQSWHKTVTIGPGLVVHIKHVSLYLAKPIELPNPAQYASLIPFYSVRDSRLRLEDGEIWFDSKLVSRFDEAPSDALVLPNEHIAYLHGDEIRVVENNGENDQLLYKRQTADATTFVLIDNVLVFNDIAGLKAIKIQ